jgi:hypothetical protein
LNPANQMGNLKLSPVDVNEGLIPALNPSVLVLGMEGLKRVSQVASSPATEKGQHINYKMPCELSVFIIAQERNIPNSQYSKDAAKRKWVIEKFL